MNIVLTRPAAASGELLLGQFVWTFPTPATLTPPSGWTLVDRIFGTGIVEAVYSQSGPLTSIDETWTISSNQAWAASIANVGTAAVGAFSHASGNSTTLGVTAPVITPNVTDLAAAFYGVLNFNPVTGSQTPGCQMNAPRVSAFWEYAPAYIAAINIGGTVPLAADWIEIMVVLTGSPSIVPSKTYPHTYASGG
jgi:hypothetical protein